jgi:hypothetical protein
MLEDWIKKKHEMVTVKTPFLFLLLLLMHSVGGKWCNYMLIFWGSSYMFVFANYGLLKAFT